MVEDISGNVVSGSLVLVQVIDDRRGRVRLEVIVVVAQSAPPASAEAIDAEVDVVAGGRMLARAERLDVAGKALRAAESPLDSMRCLQPFPLPVAQWDDPKRSRAERQLAQPCWTLRLAHHPDR